MLWQLYHLAITTQEAEWAPEPVWM